MEKSRMKKKLFAMRIKNETDEFEQNIYANEWMYLQVKSEVVRIKRKQKKRRNESKVKRKGGKQNTKPSNREWESQNEMENGKREINFFNNFLDEWYSFHSHFHSHSLFLSSFSCFGFYLQ